MNVRLKDPRTKRLLEQFSIIIMIFLLGVLFSVINTRFMSVSNLTNIIRQASIMIVVACGSTFVMIGGNIDIAVGAVGCLTSIVTALMMKSGVSMFVAIPVALVLSSFLGMCSGMLVTKYTIPPMIATLAMMNLCTGVANLLTSGTAVYGLPENFDLWGRGYIGPIPMQVVVMVIVAVICHLLLSRTPFGRHVYAIGGNPRVAQLSGIKVDRDVRLHYIIGGLCSALAGIMMCSRMGSAQPTMGTQWSMDNITAIVIGGNSFRGGSGSIINSVLGVLLLTMITNSLNIIGVNVFWQLVVTSVILIITIVMNARRT